MSAPVRGLNDEEPPAWRRADATLHAYDIKKKKAEAIISGLSGYDLSRDRKKLAYRKGKEIYIVDAGSKPAGEIENKVAIASLPLEIDTAAEWQQIFNEAWRLQRDFFWAQNMVGVD